jgi:hypothetical protein
MAEHYAIGNFGRTPNIRRLPMGDHGGGKDKTVTVVVDGTPYEVPKKDFISYSDIVTLAYPDFAQHPEITYSVTYTRGHSDKPEGILSPGESVRVKEGMSFRVNRTGQS